MSAIWPSAEAVARALVVASGPEGEDPVSTLAGAAGRRGRVYALLALAHAFPAAPRDRLACCLGVRAESAKKFVSNTRFIVRGQNGQLWFDLDRLNAVPAALGWPAMTRDEADRATFAAGSPFAGSPPAEAGPAADAIAERPAEPAGGLVVEMLEHLTAQPPQAPLRDPEEREARFERMKAWRAGAPPPEPSRALTIVVGPAARALTDAFTIMRKGGRDVTIMRKGGRSVAARRELGPARVIFSPDAPLADDPDIEIVTAAQLGDPPPARSALNFSHPEAVDRRASRVAIRPCGAAPRPRDPDRAFVERWYAEAYERSLAGGAGAEGTPP